MSAAYVVPGECAGQIVEVAYAATPGGVVERRTDRSDRTVSYRRARWTDALRRWDDRGGAANTTPPAARWARITEAEAARLVAAES